MLPCDGARLRWASSERNKHRGNRKSRRAPTRLAAAAVARPIPSLQTTPRSPNTPRRFRPRLPVRRSPRASRSRNANGALRNTIIAAISGNANFFCHCTDSRAVSNPACRKLAMYCAELPPVHLVILAHLAAEIAGRFGQFGQRRRGERLVAQHVAVGVEVAHPSAGQHPRAFARFPSGARRVDAAANLKCPWIELEDIQAAEELPVGIEELVVVDLRVLAEDPLPRRARNTSARAGP